MKKNTPLTVALVHDFLREYGGGERVLEALHELFPAAPVYVAFADKKALGLHWKNFADWDIRESWITRIPFYKTFFSPLRVLSPQFFQSFDLSAYDVVISSSNAYFAKAVQVKHPAKHICYCHTPARSLYGYSTRTDWKKKPVIHFFGTLINHYLRVVDVKVSQKVDFFIANSLEVQRRIQKFYHRDATVIFPPVNIPAQLNHKKREYFLYVNRLGFTKHPEIAVEACTRLNVPLKVVGTGSSEAYLHEIAGTTIQFYGSVSDEKLSELYDGAKALIYPVEDEDFGIVPVEAMSHGVPVLAHRSGGPCETILEGETGLFFDQLTVDAVIGIMKKFETIHFDSEKLYAHARSFNKDRFQKEIMAFIALAV